MIQNTLRLYLNGHDNGDRIFNKMYVDKIRDVIKTSILFILLNRDVYTELVH